MELWLGKSRRGNLPKVSDCCSFVVVTLVSVALTLASSGGWCHNMRCSDQVCGGLLRDLAQQGNIMTESLQK